MSVRTIIAAATLLVLAGCASAGTPHYYRGGNALSSGGPFYGWYDAPRPAKREDKR